MFTKAALRTAGQNFSNLLIEGIANSEDTCVDEVIGELIDNEDIRLKFIESFESIGYYIEEPYE